MATDFGGRSFDTAIDPSLVEYLPLIKKFTEAMADFGADASSPELVADVIWAAATDGTDTLRYRAGADAEAILTLRQGSSDADMKAAMVARFGL